MAEFHSSESLTLSYLRVLSLTFIVSCHILQALGSKYAWVLNIGVQIFFFLSGYLYGHKEIKDWTLWFWKRVQKIYIPFITIAMVFMGIYAIFTETRVSIVNVVAYMSNIQWFMGGVKGLGHLWFVTAIMLCYLITPILQAFRSVACHFCIALLAYGLLEFYFAQYALELFMALFIYSFGYLFANLSARMQKILIVFLALYSLYILYRLEWVYILQYDSLPNRLFHTYIGITFSIVFILLFWKVLEIKHHPQVIKVLDKYSYEIYLTHHPLILGSMAFINITNCLALNIFLILLITSALSYTLRKICNSTFVCSALYKV